MKNTARSIFRASALQRYHQSRQMATLPRFIPGWIFVCGWAVLLLFLLLGISVLLTEFPDYRTIPAVYLVAGSGDDITLGVALAPQEIRQMQPGQKLLLTPTDGGKPVAFTIIEIDPQPRTTGQIQSQFSLSKTTLPQTMNVIRVRPIDADTLPENISANQAQVQIGTSRLISVFSGY